MITKAGKVMTKKFLFISSFFYLAAAALPMTEARAADPDTDPVNITCPGGSCDNQTIDNNGEMTVNAEGVAKENTIGGFRLFFCWRCGQRAARQAEKEWCRFHGVVRYRSLDPYDMGAMEMQAL